ncbi:MAG: DUF2202 domain-containing protein [Prolixibacteraceae bacterium]|nr:DUF2202 domain-containing protein [Prolixibacteraceae bacterium]
MKTTVLLIAIAVNLIFASCQKDEEVAANLTVTSQIEALPTEPLNADELASLQQMREEEKLARDVYAALYEKWKINVFTNILSSEQKHTDAVLTLLNKYDLADPVGNNVVGVFSDSKLQSLYTQLVTLGSASVLDAYKVGATIEDLDIFDLELALSKSDNQDIKYVYDLLTMGSRNHMRSFYSQIISLGGSYSAQFISQTELEAIVTSAKETGSSW